MSPKLSIIVPVYNSGRFIVRCVSSILSQTFKDFELILVDDGSTDNCVELCEEFILKDVRVKVLHQDNSGPAQARNLGIQNCTGEYIGFVDADDYIDSEMYLQMYQQACKNDSDIVICDYIIHRGNHYETISVFPHDSKNMDKDEIRKNILPYFCGYENNELNNFKKYCPFADYSSYVWLGIYKTEILNKNNITFPSEKIYYNEDNLFNLQFISHTCKLSYLSKPFYHYVVHDSSFTKGFNNSFYLLKLNKYEYLEQFFTNHQLMVDYKIRLTNKICVEIPGIINYYVYSSTAGAKRKVSVIEAFLTNTKISCALKKFENKALPFNHIRFFIFLAQKKCFYILYLLSSLYFFLLIIKSKIKS